MIINLLIVGSTIGACTGYAISHFFGISPVCGILVGILVGAAYFISGDGI